jgi:hypothetical protein
LLFSIFEWPRRVFVSYMYIQWPYRCMQYFTLTFWQWWYWSCIDFSAKHGICKSYVVVNSRNRRWENTQFLYNSEPLTIVEDFQYLGIIFSRKGSFKVCIFVNPVYS